MVGALLFGIVPLSMGILGFIGAGMGYAAVDTGVINFELINVLLPKWAVIPFLFMIISGLLSTIEWVSRGIVKPNDYNPNKVSKQNLELLKQSILSNGWTLPIVVRSDFTIIDGFHRWTIAGEEPLLSMLDGKVPVVIVDHKDKSGDIYGTVTHNRARGTHLLGPMKAIMKELMNEGKSVEEIGKQLGMKPEEVFRLSDFSKDDFLKMMVKSEQTFSKAEFITKI